MSELVEVDVTFTMEVNWDPDDKIPVVMGDRVVGMVTNVEAFQPATRLGVVGGETHYRITMLIEAKSFKAAAMGAAFDPTPPLRMFFPRPINEINWTMVM